MTSPTSGEPSLDERRRQELELLRSSVARLRAGVMAVVFGMTGGLTLFLATVWLLVRGGTNVGKHLNLLGHYFPGYSVTWPGSLLGLVYGALVGAMMGGGVAWVYNRVASRHDRF
jgi:hypothetical protein